jgi:hypothetical protein
MKSLFIIPIFLLLFSCNSESNVTQTGESSIPEERPDTIVGVQVVLAEVAGTDYIQKEYFIIIKSDTSSFSCIITENKFNGKISIHYKYSPYEKMPALISSDDTVAVAEYVSFKKNNPKLNYKDQVKELKLILNYASKDYDLRKLSSMKLAMLSVDDLSQSITKQYISQYGETFPPNSNQKVATLIENSHLRKDLNNILSPYLVIVNKTSVDGLMYYVPQDSQAGAKRILDGMVIFNLIPNY